jgi:hypothetical protein
MQRPGCWHSRADADSSRTFQGNREPSTGQFLNAAQFVGQFQTVFITGLVLRNDVFGRLSLSYCRVDPRCYRLFRRCEKIQRIL